MTKKALAEAMAYDPSRVSHIEAGRQAPTEGFTRQAEAVLQTGGALWGLWESIIGVRLGLDEAPAPERELRTPEFIAWLADHSHADFRTLYTEVCRRVARLESEPPSVRLARAHARRRVTREQLAAAVADYYAEPDPAGVFYRARVGDKVLSTSVLTRPEWLDVAVLLGTEAEAFRYRPPAGSYVPRVVDATVQAALQRLASVEVADTVMINNPLFQLVDVDLSPGRLAATVSLVDFADHALTTELMEGELLDAITGPGGLAGAEVPLRDTYLPTIRSAFALDERACVGGGVSLLAIARGARHGQPPDYVILAQERSSAVLNATGKLAVIPKAFHQPTGEPADEAALSISLRRELEEELLGREDLEQLAVEGRRHVDVMHARQLTEPMAWLLDRGPDALRMECTGLGFNVVTSNYEFACLLVIEDEAWWDRYGHLVATNWEAERVHRYSTLDTAGLTALVTDPRWGNESLFALIQGLRRLADVGDPRRVALPAIALGSSRDPAAPEHADPLRNMPRPF